MAPLRRSRASGLAIAAAALAGVCAPAYVASQGRSPLQPQRRDVVAALGASLMLPELPAVAGDRDRASMVLGVRRQAMPKIIKGYKLLKAEGQVSEEFISTKLKGMTKALQAYGSINRLSEAPDKISRKLQKDVDAFSAAAKERNFEETIAALELFRNDIPAGVGEFSWDSNLPIDLGNKEPAA